MHRFKKAFLPLVATLSLMGALLGAPSAGAMVNVDTLPGEIYAQTYPGTIYNQCAWRQGDITYNPTLRQINVFAAIAYSDGPGCAGYSGIPSNPAYLSMKIQMQKLTGGNWVGYYSAVYPAASSPQTYLSWGSGSKYNATIPGGQYRVTIGYDTIMAPGHYLSLWVSNSFTATTV